MHPFVAIMRKYCIDYTNSHDQSIYDDIMDPSYVVNSFGMELPRDTMYQAGVAMIFETAPGLGIVVHELVLNGDRLAMHFSEHAAVPSGDDRALVCWHGIGLYKWNGSRLTENWVEQDYFSMSRQVERGQGDILLPVHLDPWMWTKPVLSDPAAEATVRAWVEKGDLADAPDVEIDDTRMGVVYEPVFDIDELVVDDIFSAGSTVPFHITVTGRYKGGLGDACAGREGQVGQMGISGIARVADGAVAKVEAVTCKIQAISTLTGEPLDLGF
jgi:hypothetical protein